MTHGKNLKRNIIMLSEALSLTALLFSGSCSSESDEPALPDGRWESRRVDGATERLDFDGSTLKTVINEPGEDEIDDKVHIEAIDGNSFREMPYDTVYYRLSDDDRRLYLYDDSAGFARNVPVEVYDRSR